MYSLYIQYSVFSIQKGMLSLLMQSRFLNISMWHRHQSILDHTNCFCIFINKKVQIIKFVLFIIFNTCKYLAYVFLLFCHSQGKKGQTTPLELNFTFFPIRNSKDSVKSFKNFFLSLIIKNDFSAFMPT